jgi:hypothetical protein
MNFNFIDNDWANFFKNISQRNTKHFKFITPFIQLNTIKDIINKRSLNFNLITRFNLNDFYNGVSNLDALEYLIKNGGTVKGIKNLHSKLYLFDSKEAILSSANLTQAALLRNYEFGMHTVNPEAISVMEQYFDNLWSQIPTSLKINQINSWRNELDAEIQKGKNSYKVQKLKDYGCSIDNTEKDGSEITSSLESKQFFIKFFGARHRRSVVNRSVLEEVKRSGCHWACSYPTNKSPRNVKEGALIFMGRLVSNPNDIMIYGYAIGHSFKEKRDKASPAEIKKRPWKSNWSKYIRVHGAKFINGSLKDGISMNYLMKKFDYNSFMPTLKNKIKGKGNINPRKAYSQQAAVELTPDAGNWLLTEMENKLKFFGKISDSVLSKIE